MAEQLYQRAQIATQQLRTAILLFLRGCSRASVITLAAAASGTLEQLVRTQRKTTFVDYGRSFVPGPTLARGKYKHHLNELLGVNALKHMSPTCSETFEIALEENAVRAITKAIADHVMFYGYEHDFVTAFLQWAWVYLDGPKIVQEYNRLSMSAKKYGREPSSTN